MRANADNSGPLQGEGITSTSKGPTLSRVHTYPWMILNATRILDLLDETCKAPKLPFTTLLILFECLTAFSAFEADLEEKTGEMTEEWRDVLRGDRLSQCVSNAFSADGLEETEKRKCTSLKDIVLYTLKTAKENPLDR